MGEDFGVHEGRDRNKGVKGARDGKNSFTFRELKKWRIGLQTALPALCTRILPSSGVWFRMFCLLDQAAHK
jgi:hypothetical protein